MTLLAAALDYAACGFMVFPCQPESKEPACEHGFKDATANPARLRRWFGSSQNNIAIATGMVSGIWMLDIDGDLGATTLAELEARHGALPATLTSISSSGCHLWFRADGELQCSAGRIGAGLDVRADGGYAMAPPSVHPDGPTYRWLNDRPPARAPRWLIELARKPEPKPAAIPPRCTFFSSSGISSYARAALEREINELSKTPAGRRNHALNRASFALHQLVAGGELDGGEVQRRLIDAATANGLMTDQRDGPRSVMRTIASGARAGMQSPRNRRGRR
jgi:hypothetical protein